jgi:hypothetical protein
LREENLGAIVRFLSFELDATADGVDAFSKSEGWIPSGADPVVLPSPTVLVGLGDAPVEAEEAGGRTELALRLSILAFAAAIRAAISALMRGEGACWGG